MLRRQGRPERGIARDGGLQCWVAGARLAAEAPLSKDQDGEQRLGVLDKADPEVTMQGTQLPGSGSLLETRLVSQRGWKASLKTPASFWTSDSRVNLGVFEGAPAGWLWAVGEQTLGMCCVVGTAYSGTG